MVKNYPLLNSPLLTKNTVIKNRFLFPNALPKTQQGPETYPADPIISFYTHLAENGVGVICYADMTSEGQRSQFNNDEQHFPMYDINDPSVENYISQVADNVHYYGSRIIVDVSAGNMLRDLDVVANEPRGLPPEMLDHEVHISQLPKPKKAMDEGDMEAQYKLAAQKAMFYKRMGFDGGYLGLFQGTYGNFLSPAKNIRTDEYGGSFENRVRFPLEVIKRVKEAVSDDFMLVLDINQLDPALPFEEVALFTHMLEPYISLIHNRANQEQTTFASAGSQSMTSLELSERLKKSGIKTPIATWTGFMELGSMERVIAEGKTDMIAAGRFFLCNPDMGQILRDGRDDDVVPCLLCNKCHGDTLTGPWVAVCSVNPQIGLEGRIEKLTKPPRDRKRVAVIGGGPAGLKAAAMLSDRGHEVSLFEASGELGGQIKTAKYPSFKWPLENYRKYLVRQVENRLIEIHMGTTATPDMIKNMGFDVIIAATGAVPKLPAVQGSNPDGVWNHIDVYGRESELGKRVICIGGSESSVETALYLAENGHEVTILCRKKRIAYDGNPIHYIDGVRNLAHKTCTVLTNAVTTAFSGSSVTYTDNQGLEHFIECDSVVALGGMSPLQEEAMAFYDSAEEFYMVGDCYEVGNIQKCNRHALALANRL